MSNVDEAGSHAPGYGRSEPSPRELVERARQGDQQAWEALVERFAGLVWSVIRGFRLRPADAADVSQTTWLRLAEHLGALRDPDRVGSWLATAAGRECLVLLRRNRWQVPTDGTDLLEMPDLSSSASLDAALLLSERESLLWQAFATLPERSQILLRLLFAEPPASYEEISALTGLAVGSIGPTRARCLAQLRERLPS